MKIYYWDMETTFSDFNIPEALMQYGMILQMKQLTKGELAI